MSTFPLKPSPGNRAGVLDVDPEIRAVQIGVIATILVHLLLYYFLPLSFQNSFTGTPVSSPPAAQFNMELAPEEIAVPEKPKQPDQYVETNPNAPENIPDNTTNFSARNQQSAQERPTPNARGDRPAMEGQTEIRSSQIVTGTLTPEQPVFSPAAPPPRPPMPQGDNAIPLQRSQDLLAGAEKIEGDNPNGFASNVARNPVNPMPVQERVEGVPDGPPIPGTIGINLPIEPQVPMPRQRIEQRARRAIFEENKVGTPNIGIIGRDAKWSSYGEYLNRMAEAVESRWNMLINDSRSYPKEGTSVVVTFVINSDGRISSIKSATGDAGELAIGWCTSAIGPHPDFSYGRWADNMVAVLGDHQELTFSFYYR